MYLNVYILHLILIKVNDKITQKFKGNNIYEKSSSSQPWM